MKNDLPGNTRQNEVGFSRGKEDAAFDSAEIGVRAFRDEGVSVIVSVSCWFLL